MSDDTINTDNDEIEEVDTEGHLVRGHGGLTDAMTVTEDTEDTEGHLVRGHGGLTDAGDDAEGHRYIPRGERDGEDTEGHAAEFRP